MTFGQSISTCFSKYCTFSGRASRSEYWWWFLFTFIIGCLFGIPSSITAVNHSAGSGLPIISYIVSLALFLPSLGVLFRRLHDTGKSGWWWLLGFIPVVGTIILIVFLAMPSQPVTNDYGPVPYN